MSSTTPPPNDPGTPEYLDASGGEPVGSTRGSGGRRTAVVAGGAVIGLGLVGGAVWAAMSFFATGAQPAEALPAGTIGYASVDLDPSGGQKIEAFRMIQKFPALEKELGGLDADDDLIAKAFESLEEQCDLSYADDVKPWLGYRFAVAAVDVGEEMPAPVGVLQVTDADAAEDGLAALSECGGVEDIGWVIDGDWALIAETDDIAQQVSDETAEGTLADDETYQEWTGEVGDAGVLNLYVAPSAGGYLAEAMGSFPGGMVPGLTGELPDSDGMTSSSPVPEELATALEDFQGAAATLRFDDGALEFEAVGAVLSDDQPQVLATGRGDDMISTLPADTAAAVGFGLAEGWMDSALEQVVKSSGGEMTVDELETELEAATGLTTGDVEALVGESTAIALGSDITADAFFNSSDGSDVPVGAKVQGDGAAIQDVLDRLADTLGADTPVFGNDADGDLVAIGPNPDYRADLLAEGELGDSEVFQNVVREADDASAIFFVNFDAGDWLTSLAEGDQEAIDNLEPLQGLGFTTWNDDGASHAVFRLTTN